VRIYLDLVVALNFGVDLFLLLCTNRLTGFPQNWRRVPLAALLGGVYAGVCLLPGWQFLGNWLWRFVSLGAMSAIAFGISHSALRRCLVFSFLTMSLGGFALVIGSGGVWSVLLTAGVMSLSCFVGFRGRVRGQSLVPVELTYGKQRTRLLALQDTGNTLCDPVTGQTVLIVGPQIALQLLGLTPVQLQKPVETVASGVVPGLRLVPYKALGCASGMLAALKLQNVRIGKWQGSTLVAFSPQGLDAEGTYQALTGGVV